MDSREKFEYRRIGVIRNISKGLVERFTVAVGTVEVRLQSISLVPGFRFVAGSPSIQSIHPGRGRGGSSLRSEFAVTRCWGVR